MDRDREREREREVVFLMMLHKAQELSCASTIESGVSVRIVTALRYVSTSVVAAAARSAAWPMLPPPATCCPTPSWVSDTHIERDRDREGLYSPHYAPPMGVSFICASIIAVDCRLVGTMHARIRYASAQLLTRPRVRLLRLEAPPALWLC
jgi:hypothetical protein